MNLKELLPMKLNYSLKYKSKYFWGKDLPKLNEKKGIVYYLDAPDYGNIGDLAIRKAINEFINKNLPQNPVVEIEINEFPRFFKSLKKIIRPIDTICLTGGGNMGATYQSYEMIRRLIINAFPKNKIIIFPQTIDYKNNSYGQKELLRSSKIYSSHKSLYIVAREKHSYNLMRTYYPRNNILLCPDIVFYLENIEQTFDRNGILLCLRDDNESKLKIKEKELIEEFAREKSENVKITDTITQQKMNSQTQYNEVVKDKLKEFKKSKLIITDRLHGMIFAAITETPCIVLANNNHKITGVYEWIKHFKYIKFLNEVLEIEKAIDETLNIKETFYSREELIKDYFDLAQTLK